jgi:hypothetical protein
VTMSEHCLNIDYVFPNFISIAAQNSVIIHPYLHLKLCILIIYELMKNEFWPDKRLSRLKFFMVLLCLARCQ